MSLFDPAFLRKLEMLALVSKRVFNGKMRGERRSSRKGGSVEFSDYRQYLPGDDFRAIDWNAYARLEHLFLKLFVEEEDLAVHVLLDASASMGFGTPCSKLDLGKKLAGALLYCALAGYDRGGLAVLGSAAGPLVTVPLVRGKGRIVRLLERLEAVRPAPPVEVGDAAVSPKEAEPISFNAGVRAFVERRPRPGLVIVISDLLDPAGVADGLKRLRYGAYEPRVIHVLAPEELEPAIGGDCRFVDSEGRSAPVDLSLDTRAIRLYEKRLGTFLAETEALCRAHGIGYVRAPSSTDVEDLVLRGLRAAEMLG